MPLVSRNVCQDDGQVRVGYGRYNWHFNEDGKVRKLVINIDVMKVLPGTMP
jgi:hypothetical protein